MHTSWNSDRVCIKSLFVMVEQLAVVPYEEQLQFYSYVYRTIFCFVGRHFREVSLVDREGRLQLPGEPRRVHVHPEKGSSLVSVSVS